MPGNPGPRQGGVEGADHQHLEGPGRERTPGPPPACEHELLSFLWAKHPFVTAHMADTRNPMVALIFDGRDSRVSMKLVAPELPSLGEMKRRVARDPVDHAIF